MKNKLKVLFNLDKNDPTVHFMLMYVFAGLICVIISILLITITLIKQ